jgi:hypothetical protein
VARVLRILLCAWLVAASALAQTSDPPNVIEARQRVQRGQALFDRGDFDAALTEFESAYEMIGAHPRRYLVLYNVALCHERRFRYDVALTFYRRYLEEGGEGAENAEQVRGTVHTLESLVGVLHVRVEPAGVSAEVWVDDRQIGTAPGDVRMPAGMHDLELRAEGYLSERRSVQLPAGGEREVDVALRPVGGFSGLPVEPFWITAGAGAATIVAACVFGVVSLVASGQLQSRLADPIERWSVSQSDIDNVGIFSITADVLFVSSAVIAAAAGVLALLTDWSGRTSAQRSGLPWRIAF